MKHIMIHRCMRTKNILTPACCLMGLLLSACSTLSSYTELTPGPGDQPSLAAATSDSRLQNTQPVDTTAESLTRRGREIPKSEREHTATDSDIIHYGSGQMINSDRLADERHKPLSKNARITLNFESADIRELIKQVLGKLLKRNYTVDNRVAGKVTLQTSRPLSPNDLMPLLENILRMNNAVIVRDGQLDKIIPANMALHRSHLTSVLGIEQPGYKSIAYPLRFIAAAEMKKILEPMMPKGEVLHIIADRNLLILSGIQPELARLTDLIQMFDVDWLSGMSVGLFNLEFVEPKTVIQEIRAILGQNDTGLSSELLRLEAINRLNAVLAVSAQRSYIDKVREWIAELDRSSQTSGRRLFVYHVQNGKAKHLAGVLDELFTTSARSADPARLTVPGQEPLRLTSASPGSKTVSSRAKQSKARATPANGRINNPALENIGAIRIIADEEQNSLVILANPVDYEKIRSALRRLDITPLQVLIEASIMEIELKGDLNYGVEWFFRNNNLIDGKTGQGLLDLGGSGLSAVVPGFSYSLVNSSSSVQAVVNFLASESDLHVIASPSIFVLDNQTAEIHVGDQVPVRTSESTNLNSGEAAIITSTIQFRDTGVRLNVSPRVNAGGLVILDINQDVTDVDVTTTSGIDSPTFNQRTIKTAVAVQNGQTVMLGGLIRDNNSRIRSGVPVLHRLPVVGNLFGQTSKQARRSELIVTITPRVVHDDSDARRITTEFQNKLHNLSPPSRP